MSPRPPGGAARGPSPAGAPGIIPSITSPTAPPSRAGDASIMFEAARGHPLPLPRVGPQHRPLALGPVGPVQNVDVVVRERGDELGALVQPDAVRVGRLVERRHDGPRVPVAVVVDHGDPRADPEDGRLGLVEEVHVAVDLAGGERDDAVEEHGEPRLVLALPLDDAVAAPAPLVLVLLPRAPGRAVLQAVEVVAALGRRVGRIGRGRVGRRSRVVVGAIGLFALLAGGAAALSLTPNRGSFAGAAGRGGAAGRELEGGLGLETEWWFPIALFSFDALAVSPMLAASAGR
eukprot:CAMPEP_0173439354 /NCGR_PEP_ID=MMETSP1357-20121228/20906_1 /TAXON_ID=77926 /ORGANISM="Hemiselmis rufescens, Strain PCC563" /LENGTH=289 /DNA_ID=CAMNT_0014404713 /DNA_START=64 /DNA_END=935 /DNA_ORIENTATION=+